MAGFQDSRCQIDLSRSSVIPADAGISLFPARQKETPASAGVTRGISSSQETIVLPDSQTRKKAHSSE